VKSAARRSLDAVVAGVAPQLEHAGFRKRGDTFTRALDDGMTHVVDFQLARVDPPGTREIPPLRVDLHGRFTVTLGVFVPEMTLDPRSDAPAPPWLREADCQLRMRIGRLLPGGEDTWWELDDSSAAAALAGSALATFGLPWLDRLATRAALVAAYESEGGEALGMAPRAPVEIAFLVVAGDPVKAETMLRDHLASDLRPQHRSWVEGLLAARGMGNLLTPLR